MSSSPAEVSTIAIKHTARARRAAALGAFFALLAAALFTGAGLAAPEASAGPYVNPSPVEIREKLRSAAVIRLIPPRILFGIAFQESTWQQFDAKGDPLIGSDRKGIGIMQVTTIPAGVDMERLKTDIDYNIAVGADILVEKWWYAPTVIPFIGDGDPRCYENWFFAVWAYNGWKAANSYPYKVWGHIAAGPEGWWIGLPVTPVPTESLVGGFPVPPVQTPLPAHWWSPVPLPKPALSVPRVQKRVDAGVRFTVSGTLSPQHPAGASSVEIRATATTAPPGRCAGLSWPPTSTSRASPSTWPSSAWGRRAAGSSWPTPRPTRTTPR